MDFPHLTSSWAEEPQARSTWHGTLGGCSVRPSLLYPSESNRISLASGNQIKATKCLQSWKSGEWFDGQQWRRTRIELQHLTTTSDTPSVACSKTSHPHQSVAHHRSNRTGSDCHVGSGSNPPLDGTQNGSKASRRRAANERGGERAIRSGNEDRGVANYGSQRCSTWGAPAYC